MPPWVEMTVTIVVAFIASSGFWAWLQKRSGKKDLQTKLLVGLAHDRIIYLGMEYVKRGYITKDEYENLYDYLYIPYKNLGGNGAAERVINEISKLEIRDTHITTGKKAKTSERQNV